MCGLLTVHFSAMTRKQTEVETLWLRFAFTKNNQQREKKS